MMHRPVVGRIRKRFLVNVSGSLGLGTALAYGWWFVSFALPHQCNVLNKVCDRYGWHMKTSTHLLNRARISANRLGNTVQRQDAYYLKQHQAAAAASQ